MSAPMPVPPPGQQPTQEQIREMQRQIAEAAQKEGLTIQQYVERLKAQAIQQHQQQQQQTQAAQQQQQQQMQEQQQQGQQQPITPGPPKPEAIAVANFLRSQDLKSRTCIFQEKRKDMFRGTHDVALYSVGPRMLIRHASQTRNPRPRISRL